MYESFFDLSRRPFGSIPQTDQYCSIGTIELARQTLIRCIDQAEGAGVVIGPSGTGKTLLCQLLGEHFSDRFGVVLLSSGRLSSRRALLQAILYELGRPYRGMDEGELRLALVEYLTRHEDAPAGVILLVDEAHTLPRRLLEEIRMITNLVTGGEPKVRLVLAGGPLLEERLASPRLDSFSQRIVARCYLESFTRSETKQYIDEQVRLVGAIEPLFSDDACRAIHLATDGVPRLVNQVCNHALMLVYARGSQQVAQEDAEEAWADLQQLPTPFSDENPDDLLESQGVIEFGSLDDAPSSMEQGDTLVRQANADAVPMLRVTDEDEMTDPINQIEQISQTLTGIDEKFQPAGSIGPEVTLVFDDAKNPFLEEFEEEEVIHNRSSMPSIKRYVEGEGFADNLDHPLETIESTENAILSDHASNENHRSVASEEIEEVTLEIEQTQGTIEDETPELETVSLRLDIDPQEAEAIDQSIDHDTTELIIVEDGYEDLDISYNPPAPKIRPQEYGQLFATLRKGG